MHLALPFRPIRLTRLEITLEAIDPIPLEGFIGPTLRGFLGAALHDASCDDRGQPSYKRGCLYHDIFEAPRPAPGEQNPPPPFVLHPPPGPARKRQPGESIRFGLTLFGAAGSRAPALVWALYRYGLNGGLSRERRRVLVREVVAVTPSGDLLIFAAYGGPVPEGWEPEWSWSGQEVVERRLAGLSRTPRQLELQLASPLDLREDKRAVQVLEFQHLLRSLLRSASSHARCHGEEPLELDFYGLKQASLEVKKVSDGTHWVPLQHHSYRQDRTIPVQTRLGTLTFEGELEPFLGLLSLGERIHVGKSRTMGFGAMRWREVG